MTYKELENIGCSAAVAAGIKQNICWQCKRTKEELDFCVNFVTRNFSMCCRDCVPPEITNKRIKTTTQDIFTFKLIHGSDL